SGARVLVKVGDSTTTDHISPAGSIKVGTPAADYLREHGVEVKDFNSYGSRRGNHEVMIRGTFANIRLRNQIAPGTEGGYTRDFTQPDGPVSFIYDASVNYAAQGTPLVVLAGKEYGSGSSRDWAAKGTALLGVRAVIAESYERIHRSNLIGMGVLPLQCPEGETADSLGLTGEETFDITGVTALNDSIPSTVRVKAGDVEFDAVVRIDTPGEADYYRHGGIMQYVLRNLLSKCSFRAPARPPAGRGRGPGRDPVTPAIGGSPVPTTSRPAPTQRRAALHVSPRAVCARPITPRFAVKPARRDRRHSAVFFRRVGSPRRDRNRLVVLLRSGHRGGGGGPGVAGGRGDGLVAALEPPDPVGALAVAAPLVVVAAGACDV